MRRAITVAEMFFGKRSGHTALKQGGVKHKCVNNYEANDYYKRYYDQFQQEDVFAHRDR